MLPLRLPLSLVADAPPELDLGRYLTTCGLLVGLIVLLGWAFRRFVAGALKKRARARSLQIIDMLPLGGRQKLCVVRCYDRTFVLGLGADVHVVAELDAESVDAPAERSEPAADRRAFARELLAVHAELVEAEESENAARSAPTAPTTARERPSTPESATSASARPAPAPAPASAPTGAVRTASARPEPEELEHLRAALRRPEGVLG